MLKKVHISVGDLNGISPYLLLKNHERINTICQPIYHIDSSMLEQSAQLLRFKLPSGLQLHSPSAVGYQITPRAFSAASGSYSFASFKSALENTISDKNSSLLNMPVHKKAWKMAGIDYLGHTDYFRRNLEKNVIMVLGCQRHFVALYSDHIALRDVPASLNVADLLDFLLSLAQEFDIAKAPITVLGLNPHAGEEGEIGSEEKIIKKAIAQANRMVPQAPFLGPVAADSYFYLTKKNPISYTAALYHDQGLIGLKSLYFKSSIQITLKLPFCRVSPDHGPAFELAYRLDKAPAISEQSYLNAVKYAAVTGR